MGRGGNKRGPWLNTSRSEKEIERFFLCLDSCETETERFLPVKYIKGENGLIPTLFSLFFSPGHKRRWSNNGRGRGFFKFFWWENGGRK